MILGHIVVEQGYTHSFKMTRKDDTNYDFEDVSSSLKAPCWQFCLYDKRSQMAKCNFKDCGQILKAKNGNTSSCIGHLQRKHGVLQKPSW